MKTYVCWDDDNGSEEMSAQTIDADNWAEAAEKFATRCYGREQFETMDVRVRAPNGALYGATVDAEVEVTFSLSLRQKLEPGKPVEPQQEPTP